MLSEERRRRILEILGVRTSVRVADLSQELGVSEATIRRDLDAMDSNGDALRVHGGALLNQDAPPEPPVLQRGRDNQNAKRAIGRLAASMIHEGEAVFLGSGTTTLEVARQLVTRSRLTVVTNALTIINVFARVKSVSLVAIGGMLRPSEMSFVGHIAEAALSEVRVDKVVMGIRAISLQAGLTNEYMPEVMTDRAILNLASQKLLVADHTKFGRVASAFVAPLTMVSTLVTDSRTDPGIVERIRAQGIDVYVAEPAADGVSSAADGRPGPENASASEA
jgi:DeoR/GlpR family transcriptional regulator of sugar metabolism